jgi:hypothetical protein
VGAGAAGLTLRDVGELLRRRHPRHPLFELGFASVAELVEALVEPGELALLRRPEGHLLVIPRSADVQPADAQPADAQPADAQPADAQPGEGQPGEGQPADASADEDLSSDDPGDDDHGDDDLGDNVPEVTAEPGVLHPIYRAFGLGHDR